jgi:deazaflavin-dependent oxidoreductase (nitroreductase family)
VAKILSVLCLTPTFGFVILFLAIPVAVIFLIRLCKRPLAAFHRAIENRVAQRFAARLPGFAVVKNRGRKSGKLYRTPVNVFRQNNGFLIALTYGRESGWVANVLAAGTCEIETGSVSYRLFHPLVVHDPSRRRFPFLVRVLLSLIDANDYLELEFHLKA